METGSTFTLTPPDPDLGELTHQYYYTWGVDAPWEPFHDDVHEEAVAATLTFKNIYNWDRHDNDLYVHLLDWGALGISTGYDNEGGGDNFAGMGILLEHYEDLPATAQTLVYNFTDEQVGVLNDCAADGRFALGFDPDCHFYNCGVELEILTHWTGVPEPSSMVLVAAGSAVTMLVRRRRRKIG
jgi:hypothetical protein